jgi:hypothetical protein
VKKVIARNAAGKAVVTKYSVSRREADSIRKSAGSAASRLSQGQRATIAQAKSGRFVSRRDAR